MKNEINISNIKPVKLKEEQNDSNKNKNNANKEKVINNKCINKKKILNILSCFGYFFFILLFLSIFVLNYYYTKNSFDENRNIIIPAENICKNMIYNLAKCIEEKSFSRCQNEKKNMENCYEDSFIFNQKCYIFINELELYYRKSNYKKDSKKINDLEKDLILCSSSYKHINIKEIKIKELFYFD